MDEARRQLPLRPSRDKPVLKYSHPGGAGSPAQQPYSQTPSAPTSASTQPAAGAAAAVTAAGSGATSRPPAVPLFSQSDLQMYKEQVYSNFVNNYAPVYSNGKAAGASPAGYGAVTSMASSLYRPPVGGGGPFSHMPQLSFTNYTYLSGPGTASGQAVTSNQVLSTDVRYNDQVGVKGPSRNPYARPISAKDVEPPPSNGIVPVTAVVGNAHPMMVRNGSNASLALKSSGSTSSLSSVGSSSVNTQGAAGSAQGSGKIQTNAFMRPLSSASTEHVGTKQPTSPPTGGTQNAVHQESPPVPPSRPQIQGPVVTTQTSQQPNHMTVSSAYDRHPNHNTDLKPSPTSSPLKPTVTRPPSGRKPMGIATVNPSSLGIKATGIHSAPQTRPASAVTSGRHQSRTIVRNASSGMLVAQGNQTGSNSNHGPSNNSARTAIGGSSNSSLSTKSLADSNSSGYISGTASILTNKPGTVGVVPRQAFQTNNNTTPSSPSRGGVSVAKGNTTENTNSPRHKTEKSDKKGPIVIMNKFQPRDRRPSSGSRVGSASSSRVRNPNYTPSRPYSEVSTDSDTSRNSSAGSVRGVYSNMEVGPNRGGKQTAGEEERGVTSKSNKQSGEKQEVVKNGNGATLKKNVSFSSPHAVDIQADMIQDGRVKEMPVTHTMTGTIFYRKASKGEEVIPKPPPPAKHPTTQANKSGATHSPTRLVPDGAPSGEKGEYQLEKGEEWTDEEDEDEVTMTMMKQHRGERVPGDGEADHHDDSEDGFEDDGFDDEEDDDIIDNIEDDDEGGESDDSDLCTRHLSPSRKNSATALRLKSATKRLLGLQVSDAGNKGRAQQNQRRNTPAVPRVRPVTTGSSSRGRPLSAVSTISSESDIQPALMPSLFPNVPPTVNFVTDGEKVEQLPWEVRKFLRWRMSPITPNVVKNCISRSGFRATKRNNDWIGYWGKHMKAPGFKSIREYQKVNHFPGSFQIGRKDRLWRNLSKMQVHFGKKEFGFFPQTFVLPFDLKQLKRAWEDGGNKQKWIIKPPASARGIGIRVINKWNQIPKKRSVIVQRYLARPYLINDSKFDIRLYVYVTSYDPLRIYLFDDGLARFASVKYSHSMKSINNRYMHLTNYSINKKNTEYQSNTDENVCQGHKWGLKALWGYMKQKGINVNAVWENIKDLVIKTIIVSEPYVNPLIKANVKQKFSCHELFGFDVMLDENLKPWIIEVNISPSLHSNSQLDMNIKGQMIKDLFNIAGFMIPDKNDVKDIPGAVEKYQVPSGVSMDKRLWSSQLAADERAKHAYYVQRHSDEFAQQTILETLTPDDLRLLVETIDEDSRKGSFQRVFPSNNTHKYQRFFEAQRYYNLLADAWVQKFHRMEARGIAILESHCEKGVHLHHPTSDPRHQWAPPNMSLSRDARALSAPTSASKNTGARVFPNLKRGSGKPPPGGVNQNHNTSSSSGVSSVRSTATSQSSESGH